MKRADGNLDLWEKQDFQTFYFRVGGILKLAGTSYVQNRRKRNISLPAYRIPT